jgi:transcription elongation factor Elf1
MRQDNRLVASIAFTCATCNSLRVTSVAAIALTEQPTMLTVCGWCDQFLDIPVTPEIADGIRRAQERIDNVLLAWRTIWEIVATPADMGVA